MRKINSRYSRICIAAVCMCGLTLFCLLHKPHHKNLIEIPGFFNKNHYFVPLKIHGFSLCNSPQIELMIENQIIASEIDLGWNGGVALPPSTLNHLRNKRYLGRYPSVGLTGKIYESDVYELPEIHLGKMKIFPMKAKEENVEFLEDSILQKGDQHIAAKDEGRVGWHVFKPFNVLLDCEHATIVICDSLTTLQNQGFSTDSFIESPLMLDRDSIDFTVLSEAGPLRCMLDTGSTWNLFNKESKKNNQPYRLIELDNHKELNKLKTLNETLLTFGQQFTPMLLGLYGKRLPTNRPILLEEQEPLIFDSEDCWKTQTFQISGHEFGPVEFIKIKSPLKLDAIIGMEFIY